MNWLAVTNMPGGDALSITSMVFLILAVGLALGFEFVNGFHDTANAVATVIYTHSLPPWIAVIWSGLCNLAGVLWSNGIVAYSILALLPVELVLNVGSGAGFAMIFALLTSAILWNLGTWYLGLPASSSHTLIGSILGVGLANAVLSGHTIYEGVNWGQVEKVLMSLLISPVVGFVGAGVLLLALKGLIRKPALFQPPVGKAPPPWWIRGMLMLTCTGVSFAHGSNDGQKGMGLLLLILIGILPAEYALNLDAGRDDLRKLETTAAIVQPMLDAHARAAAKDPAMRAMTAREKPSTAGKVAAAMAKRPVEPGNGAVGTGAVGTGAVVTGAVVTGAVVTGAVVTGAVVTGAVESGLDNSDAAELSQYLQTGGKLTAHTYSAVATANRQLITMVQGKASLKEVPREQRKTLRTDLYLVDQTLAKLAKDKALSKDEVKIFGDYDKLLDATTKYLPIWVKVAVAIALGCGTMIGWKRIVTTVGEKIGKEHLNYGQGMSAELIAMITIGAADHFGLPVSTTHVLSSGVAGTMAANRSGLQAATLRSILLAWVLTLPVCVIMGATLFAAGLLVVLNNLAAIAVVALVVIAMTIIIWRLRVMSGKRAPRADRDGDGVKSSLKRDSQLRIGAI